MEKLGRDEYGMIWRMNMVKSHCTKLEIDEGLTKI